MSKWIKKGDHVVVVSGNDKGKQGEVLRRTGDRVVVQGVNIRKKHQKRRDQQAASEIVSIEMPVHVSNVSLCTKDGEKIKPKVRVNADGSKVLYYLQGGKEVELRTIKRAGT
jgi:large subunit ribosomal protein L24